MMARLKCQITTGSSAPRTSVAVIVSYLQRSKDTLSAEFESACPREMARR